MKFPLRLIIHTPIRETVEFRDTLVGLGPAFRVDWTQPSCGLQLLPTYRPPRQSRFEISKVLAKQISDGFAVVVFGVERLISELSAMNTGRNPRRSDLLLELGRR